MLSKWTSNWGILALCVVLTACGGGSGGGQSGSSANSNLSAISGADQNSDSANLPNSGNRVSIAQAGTLSLQWTAPVSRSNGEALGLSEIQGFTLYFGTTVGDYPYSVYIDDPSNTSLDIPDLPAGTYYLVMTATDSAGRESGPSGVLVREVQGIQVTSYAPKNSIDQYRPDKPKHGKKTIKVKIPKKTKKTKKQKNKKKAAA